MIKYDPEDTRPIDTAPQKQFVMTVTDTPDLPIYDCIARVCFHDGYGWRLWEHGSMEYLGVEPNLWIPITTLGDEDGE